MKFAFLIFRFFFFLHTWDGYAKDKPTSNNNSDEIKVTTHFQVVARNQKLCLNIQIWNQVLTIPA